MTIKVAINGYGRIGRNTLRAIYEMEQNDIQVVAINAMGSLDVNAHLTQYDSTHGKFFAKVAVDGDDLMINGDRIKVYSDRNPANLPWGELGVDVVHECTGAFTKGPACLPHIQAGAKKVLISAPATEVEKTIVYGVNEGLLSASDQIVSNASCTTNCLAPLAKVMDEGVGIERGNMMTIHAFTNDQVLIDVYHKDLRRARSAVNSMIPTKTGATVGVGLVLPQLVGKLDGFSIRVPTINVSLVNLTFDAGRSTSVAEVNAMMQAAADDHVISVVDAPLVSTDFNHNPVSCIFDPSLTKVNDTLVNVNAYYDNEWGYSCRMVDTTLAMMKAQ